MATNGISDETNGIHGEITLPEDDAVAILRKAAKCTSVNTSVGDVLRYNVPGNEPSAWQTAEDACEALADMVERDYVRREECEGLEHANKRQARKIHDVCEANSKLKAERDELEKQLDTMRDVAREFRDERDEWKARAEAKSAKRATAVERLKNSEYHTALDDVCAMLGWGHEPHFEGATDALIDLLTDEDANDGLPLDSDVRADDVDANDANATQDTREKLEADVHEFVFNDELWFTGMMEDEHERFIRRFIDRQAAIDRKEFQSILEEIQTCMRNGSR